MDNVAIFWDYENCPVPSNVSGFAVVNNLQTLAHPFGSVRSLKAYLGLTEQSPGSTPKVLAARSELQSSGVSLVDCPHNGRKDVADKMIIVDMLAHAIDNPAPSTIILITGDRDFAYAVSILRLRRYRIILVTLPNAHPSLTAQASIVISWNDTILPSDVTVDSPNVYERLLPRDHQQECTDNDVSTSPYKTQRTTNYVHNRPDNGQLPNIPPTPRRFPHFRSPSVELNKPPVTSSQSQPTSFIQSQPSTAVHPQPPSWTADLLPPFAFKPKGLPLQNLEPQVENEDDSRDEPVPSSHGNEESRPPQSSLTSPKQNDSPVFVNEQMSAMSSNPEPDVSNTVVVEITTSSASLSVRENVMAPNAQSVVEKQQCPVPLHFEALVQCLEKYQSKGITRPLRSAVAYEIGKSGTYQKAGMPGFKQYAAKAQGLGIIDLGGADGNAWICLKPKWKNVK